MIAHLARRLAHDNGLVYCRGITRRYSQHVGENLTGRVARRLSVALRHRDLGLVISSVMSSVSS